MFERDHKLKIVEGESHAPYYHYSAADDIVENIENEDGVMDPI